MSKDIWEVDIRAASSGTDGCRCRSRPSTSSETAATARASCLGTLPYGAGSPVMAASSASTCSQRQVLPAEDVAPPVAALLERQHLPGRQVVDVGHVQHGVHVGRHAAVQEVEDELAGGRGSAIPGPDREGREHQRGRQALGDGAEHLVLGHVLGALVGAVEMPDIGEGALVGRVRARDVLEPERADGAGVDQPLDAASSAAAPSTFLVPSTLMA